MVLGPGDAEGDRGNRHRGADQWLYVVFIDGREKHEIKNTGKALLRTLNFYAPPAYRKDGNPLSRGKR